MLNSLECIQDMQITFSIFIGIHNIELLPTIKAAIASRKLQI